jgi:hypothetical protein
MQFFNKLISVFSISLKIEVIYLNIKIKFYKLNSIYYQAVYIYVVILTFITCKIYITNMIYTKVIDAYSLTMTNIY